MSVRWLVLLLAILAPVGAGAWHFLHDADAEPALIVEEPERVLTTLVADMGERHHTVTYQIRNQTRRPLRVVGTSAET
jgi:hypothetical protein